MELTFIRACLTHLLYPDRPLPETDGALRWANVYDLLRQHGLAELFCILGEAQPALWPAEMQRELLRFRYTALLYGDECAAQVRAVLGGLAQAGLPVIALKGWALIPTLYGGDYGQRTYADIDLLVRPRDVAAAEEVLRRLGYQPAVAELWPGHWRRYGFTQPYRLAAPGGHLGKGFVVGLHPGLFGAPFWDRRITTEELFERARPLQVEGVRAWQLSPEDDVVYSCGHLALHHRYDGLLRRYFELAWVIQASGAAFDWDAVVERAAAWRLTLPAQRVLGRLNGLWPQLVPPGALARVAALRTTRSERLAHDWTVKHIDNHVVRAVVDASALPGLGNRARYLLETAFPSPAYMEQRYGPAPGGLWPLSYLKRAAATLGHIVPRF